VHEGARLVFELAQLHSPAALALTFPVVRGRSSGGQLTARVLRPPRSIAIVTGREPSSTGLGPVG